MVITRFVFEWFAGINWFTVANTRFTAPLTRRGKTKFATIKWFNLCLQIIQSQTCYPLIIFFGKINDRNSQAKGLWRILILLWHMSLHDDREC